MATMTTPETAAVAVPEPTTPQTPLPESPYVRPLDTVTRADIPAVGGKAANLGEMLHAGLPVPGGFAVTVDAYRAALAADGYARQLEQILANLNVDDTIALQDTAKKAQALIQQIRVPDDVRKAIESAYTLLCHGCDVPVAVRSSATAEDAASASFAGMFESYLLVRGAEVIIARVRDCWASAFSARMLFYRAKRQAPLEMPVGVVVQRMIASVKSGVMFTANPATHDTGALVIEATWGLGEPVVQGQVTPDRYILDKKTLATRELHVSTKQFMVAADESSGEKQRVGYADSERVLTDAELTALGRLGLRVEEHYGAPQDLEFAIDGEGIHLTQTRPITTLGVVSPAATAESERPSDAAVLIRGLGASPGIASGAVRRVDNASAGNTLRDGEVLVTHMTSPDWVPVMRRAGAIVTDTGGMTSHAAIVSRELGVPCIVGTHDATRVLHDGVSVTVDGSAGTVSRGALPARPKTASSKASAVVATHADLTATKLYVNIADPEKADEVARLDVDGVGLLRAEFMLLGALGGIHPRKLLADGRHDELVARLVEPMRRIGAAFHPRPVIYRAMDFKSNEFRDLVGGEEAEPIEANPMIGYRGCFRYTVDRELFGVELAAVAAARAQCDNVHLMIPFVRTAWELRECLAMIDASPLAAERDLQRWIMAEVPSVVWRLKDYAALGITGISIGSNDLTQLVLGTDRDNDRLAPLYDERDPAVLAAIRQIVRDARANGLRTSICGQAPSVHAEYAEFLVRCGIDSISVVPDAIERTRRNVARAERRLLLEHAVRGGDCGA